MTTPPTDPTGPVVPGADPHDAGRRRHRTGWIVATVILGVAVIGLLIWAVSTQSDLDSANTTIEAQQQAAEKAGESAKQTGQNAQEASASARLLRGLLLRFDGTCRRCPDPIACSLPGCTSMTATPRITVATIHPVRAAAGLCGEDPRLAPPGRFGGVVMRQWLPATRRVSSRAEARSLA